LNDEKTMNDKKPEWSADLAVELKLSVLTPCRTTHLFREDKRLTGLVALREVILDFFVWDKFCKFLSLAISSLAILIIAAEHLSISCLVVIREETLIRIAFAFPLLNFSSLL